MGFFSGSWYLEPDQKDGSLKTLSFGKRLGFALQGIVTTWKTESSFRTQTLAIPVVILILILAKANAYWWAVISLNMGSVLAAELFNTSLEHVVDRLHPEQHASIKFAKDCAAGAVLLLSLTSLLIFCAFLGSLFTLF